MCAMIYKHRPSYPALFAAGLVLLGGSLMCYGATRQYQLDREVPPCVLMIGCGTLLLVGIFLVIAFARYKFTHLWIKPRRPPVKQTWERSRPRS